MFKILLLLCFSLSAFSQSFFGFGSKKTNSVKASIQCGGKEEKIKVKFKDSDGAVVARLENDDIDPSCLKAVKEAIQEAKNKCSEKDKGLLCTTELNQLTSAVKINPKKEEAVVNSSDEQKWISTLALPSEAEAAAVFQSKVDEIVADPSKCYTLASTTMPGNAQVNIMARYPKVFSKAIDQLSGDKGCISGLLSNYHSVLPQNTPESNPKFQQYCKSNPETESCKKAKATRLLIDKNIRKLVAANRGEDAKGWVDSSECSESPLNDYDELLNRLTEYEQELDCAPIKPGQQKIVLDHAKKPIYRLKQDADGNFEASIGLNITGSADGVHPNEMYLRVQQCMKAASNFLSPPGAPKLKVNVMTPAESGSENVPVHNVSINPSTQSQGNGGTVDYPDKFRSNIPCGTIAHELMHILGLPDEYNHDGTGECQSIPPLPSLMGGKKSDDKAGNWDENVPQALQCECKDDTCKKVFASSDEDLKKFHVQPMTYQLNNTANKMKCVISSSNTPWEKITNKTNLKKLEIVETEKHVVKYITQNLNNMMAVHRSENTCSCNPDDEACLKELNKEVTSWKNAMARSVSKCPSFTKQKKATPLEVIPPKTSATFHDSGFTLYTKTKHTGMLLPAQVALITSGHCPKVATRYKECFSWGSYNDGDEITNLPKAIAAANTKNGGGQCLNNADSKCIKVRCSNRPAYCDDPATYNSMK